MLESLGLILELLDLAGLYQFQKVIGGWHGDARL